MPIFFLGYIIGVLCGIFMMYMYFKVAGEAWTNEVCEQYNKVIRDLRKELNKYRYDE